MTPTSCSGRRKRRARASWTSAARRVTCGAMRAPMVLPSPGGARARRPRADRGHGGSRGPPMRCSDSTRHELSATTWRPMRSARPISDSVPCRPPTAIDRIGRGDDHEVAGDAEPGGDRACGRTRWPPTASAPGRMPIVCPPAPSGAARGRAHDAAEPAGHDRGATARELLADLLGPFQDAMGVGTARVTVADDRHVRRSRRDGTVSHAAGPPSWHGCQRLISSGPAAEVAAHELESRSTVPGPRAPRMRRSIQPRRSMGPPSAAPGSRAAGTARQAPGRAHVQRRPPACRQRTVRILDAVPRTRALTGGGKAPRPPVGMTRSARERPATSDDRIRDRLAPCRRRSARGRRASGASPRARPSAAHRRARVATPAGYGVRQRRRRCVVERHSHEAAPRARSSAREARVDDREQLLERSDDRHAVRDCIGGVAPVRSMSTASMPTPRAPSTSASTWSPTWITAAGSTSACVERPLEDARMRLLEADAGAGGDEVEVAHEIEGVEQLGQVPDPVAHRPDGRAHAPGAQSSAGYASGKMCQWLVTMNSSLRRR